MIDEEKSPVCNLEDLFSVFEDYLSPDDIIYSQLLASISARIAERRISMKLSQADFAEYMGVSQSLVSRWESGNCNFSIRTLAQIAAKLDQKISIQFKDTATARSDNTVNYNYRNCEQCDRYAAITFSPAISAYSSNTIDTWAVSCV